MSPQGRPAHHISILAYHQWLCPAYLVINNIHTPQRVLTILERKPSSKQETWDTDVRNPAAGNSDSMRIKALVDIQPAVTGPNLDCLLVLGQIQLRKLAEEDDYAAVITCKTRVLETPAAADGKSCADKSD